MWSPEDSAWVPVPRVLAVPPIRDTVINRNCEYEHIMSPSKSPKVGAPRGSAAPKGLVNDNMVTQLILTEWHRDSRRDQGQDKYFTYEVEKRKLRENLNGLPGLTRASVLLFAGELRVDDTGNETPFPVVDQVGRVTQRLCLPTCAQETTPSDAQGDGEEGGASGHVQPGLHRPSGNVSCQPPLSQASTGSRL